MTNATIVENNSTSHDESNQIKCNQTANGDKETQNCFINTLQIQNSHCSNNTVNNSSNAIHYENVTTTNDNKSNNTENNEVVDKNTVLKYVYKKGDKAVMPTKDKGHFKNSLKRRKRSSHESHDKGPLPSKFQKPVTVNYETSHGPREVEPLLHLRNTGNTILGANLADFNIETLHNNAYIKNDQNVTPNLKKDSSEVESLNETSDEKDKGGYVKQNDNSRKSSHESEESGESGEYTSRKSHSHSENSGEHKDYSNKNPKQSDEDSAEREDYKNEKSNSKRDDSSEDKGYQKSRRENGDSAEHEDYKNRRSSREESDSSERSDYKNKASHERGDSGERRTYKDSESSRKRDDGDESKDYKSNRNGSADSYNSAESTEDSPRTNSRYSSSYDNSKESPGSNENSKTDPNSAESQDSVETDDKDKNSHNEKQYSRQGEGYNQNNKFLPPQEHKNVETNTRKNIVNDNGKVEPQKDNLEEIDPNTAVEILPLSTATPDSEIKKLNTLLTNDNTLTNPSKGSYDNKLININDGEVKPVVEIHTENDGGSSEENNKPNLSDEVESLESILGVKEPESLEDDGQSDKIVAEKEVQSGDVKQEFERIPLNYNHNEKNLNKDIQATETPKEENTGVTKNEGTLDAFAPEDIKYDENLNIKFDDLAIKLPEITLPDDILAFTRESSPYNDENEKQHRQDVPSYEPSYYYNDNREKSRERNNKKGDDDDDADDDDHESDTGYHGYYEDDEKKQNYKKKNADAESDEEEDLYEKFVRERFGKRGTFEKRSEKLEAVPQNPELYKTIKNILKKTAEIDDQAKKSGDPNAGYMWTLEYGEKL